MFKKLFATAQHAGNIGADLHVEFAARLGRQHGVIADYVADLEFSQVEPASNFGDAVADHVVAHLSARRFNRLINFARWNCEALSNDLKVIDERFHLRLHFFAIGKHYFGSVRFDWSLGHTIERLLHHGNRFSELLHAAHISREYITMRRNRHFELELFVTRIRHIAAEVEIHSASSKSRPAGPQGERVFSGNLRHTFRAHHPDRVSGQQVFVFVHFGWKPIGKITHTLEKSNRRLERKTTNTEV